MCFILGGHLDASCMFIHPHTFICPHIVIHPHVFIHPPICPPYSSASLCSERHLHVVGVVGSPLHVGHLLYMLDTSPHMVDASPYVLSPTHWYSSLCIYVFGISACNMGNTPLMLGVWREFPHMLGVWGASASLASCGVWQYIHWVSIMLYLVPFL